MIPANRPLTFARLSATLYLDGSSDNAGLAVLPTPAGLIRARHPLSEAGVSRGGLQATLGLITQVEPAPLEPDRRRSAET